SLPAQDALRRDILAMVGVIMVGILGAGIVANRYILKPIAVLSAAVKRFRAGDFRGHIGIGLGGEFEDLAEAFNDMARRLQEKAPRT
ncbi:MAG: HAMP domain-containing protein, partial [Gammaproteobacteria bacterium]|nr:HAMP domain-containing protein [Gammaproteobacteria bacterium]